MSGSEEELSTISDILITLHQWPCTSPKELQDLVSPVEKAAQEYNIIIRAAKTKVMINTSKTLEVLVDGGELEQVDSFGYLVR